MPLGTGGIFGPDPRIAAGLPGLPDPSGMFGNRFDNPLSALSMIAGPAMMAYGFNMPGLANIGPQVLSMQAQSRQAAEARNRAERELRLKESAARRDEALRGRIAGMFGAGGAAPTVDPVAALEASRTAGGAPGPTTAAASMMAPAAATGAPGGMFAGLTPEDRRAAAMMSMAGDPLAALRFGSARSFEREKAGREAGRKGPVGPFGGTGMEAQVLNTLRMASPDTPEYRMAYETYSQPKTTVDPVSGYVTTIAPDTSWLAPPTWSAAGAPPAAPAAAAPETRTAEAAPLEAPTTRRAGSSIVTTTPGRPTRPSQPQLEAGGLASRIQGANTKLEGLEQEGTSLWQNIAGDLPLGNYMLTPEYQQYQQAKDDFINAQLRRESGAAISQSEYATADKQYFPQPGDSQEVIAQKRQNRENVLQSLEREAGPAYERPVAAGAAPALPGTAEELRTMSDDEVLNALGIR